MNHHVSWHYVGRNHVMWVLVGVGGFNIYIYIYNDNAHKTNNHDNNNDENDIDNDDSDNVIV